MARSGEIAALLSELLYSGPALRVTEKQVWVNGIAYPVGTISTVQYGRWNAWESMAKIGVVLLVLGAIATGLFYANFTDAKKLMDDYTSHRQVAQAAAESDHVEWLTLGCIACGVLTLAGAAGVVIGIKGKWLPIVTITANSGQYSTVRFLSANSHRNAFNALTQAIDGVGSSTTMNAVFVQHNTQNNLHLQGDWPQITE